MTKVLYTVGWEFKSLTRHQKNVIGSRADAVASLSQIAAIGLQGLTSTSAVHIDSRLACRDRGIFSVLQG